MRPRSRPLHRSDALTPDDFEMLAVAVKP